MKKLSIIGAVFALTFPVTAYAAADCCRNMACCEQGADCCNDGRTDCCRGMTKGGDHAGHDMSAPPAK